MGIQDRSSPDQSSARGGGQETDVLEETRGDIVVLSLNRPEKLNAWDADMRSRLSQKLERARDSTAIRAIVLTGVGDRGFCAGQDFAETSAFAADEPSHAEDWIDGWERFYRLIRSIRKPLVAAVNGTAAGSGFQALLLCDARIGHSRARFGQTEVNWGLPSITGTWLLCEALGGAHAPELVLSGRLMDADEALRLGVLHEVVPQERVLQRAIEKAGELSSQPVGAFALTKAWLVELSEDGFCRTFEAARRLHTEGYASGEPQRMMKLFFERSRG